MMGVERGRRLWWLEVGDWEWCVGKRMAVAVLASVLASRMLQW